MRFLPFQVTSLERIITRTSLRDFKTARNVSKEPQPNYTYVCCFEVTHLDLLQGGVVREVRQRCQRDAQRPRKSLLLQSNIFLLIDYSETATSVHKCSVVNVY